MYGQSEAQRTLRPAKARKDATRYINILNYLSLLLEGFSFTPLTMKLEEFLRAFAGLSVLCASLWPYIKTAMSYTPSSIYALAIHSFGYYLYILPFA